MNLPQTPSRPGLHPMVIVACCAIVLLCSVGTAAILGWLPASDARNTEANQATEASKFVQTPPPVEVVRAPQQPLAAPPARQFTSADQPAVRAVPAVPRCQQCGYVESTREISTPAQGSGVGAVGGAVVGGVLGHQVGGGHGRDLMTVLGAVGGAVAGNHIEGQVKATHSYEIVVRLDDGSVRTVHQAALGGLNAGDRIKISNGVVRHLNS